MREQAEGLLEENEGQATGVTSGSLLGARDACRRSLETGTQWEDGKQNKNFNDLYSTSDSNVGCAG